MAEPADVNLDELRRRGRRRLVGAIVLALVAAVVVPMLLESDPRPLGEDVSVRIPPVDDGKFVNKLNAPKAPAAEPPASAPVAPAIPEAPRKSLADAEKSVLGPGKVAIPEAKSPPSSAVPAKAEPPKAEPAKADPAKVASAPPAKAEPAKAAPAAASPKSEPAKAAPAAKDAHVVQLGAFTDDKGANALAGRLVRAGYPAYVEPLETSRGAIWRVRVGPYPSRDAATQARDRLKLDGHAGIVVQPR